MLTEKTTEQNAIAQTIRDLINEKQPLLFEACKARDFTVMCNTLNRQGGLSFRLTRSEDKDYLVGIEKPDMGKYIVSLYEKNRQAGVYDCIRVRFANADVLARTLHRICIPEQILLADRPDTSRMSAEEIGQLNINNKITNRIAEDTILRIKAGNPMALKGRKARKFLALLATKDRKGGVMFRVNPPHCIDFYKIIIELTQNDDYRISFWAGTHKDKNHVPNRQRRDVVEQDLGRIMHELSN